MLSEQDRLCNNEREVAAKLMDGEAILINLTTGMYYSTEKVGGFIWSLIEQRHTVGEIIEQVSGRYEAPGETVRSDVNRLASELIEERLAVLSSDNGSGASAMLAALEEKFPYEAPQLVKYSDMADSFALDPPLPGLADVSTLGARTTSSVNRE